MGLLEEIQMIVQNNEKGKAPADMGYATILSTDPLSMEVQSSRLIVTAPVAEECDNVRRRTAAAGENEVVIHPGLAVGDKVLYVRANGGQKYIILSKA